MLLQIRIVVILVGQVVLEENTRRAFGVLTVLCLDLGASYMVCSVADFIHIDAHL